MNPFHEDQSDKTRAHHISMVTLGFGVLLAAILLIMALGGTIVLTSGRQSLLLDWWCWRACTVMGLLGVATELVDELLDQLEVRSHESLGNRAAEEGNERGDRRLLVALVELGGFRVALSVDRVEQHALADDVTEVLQFVLHLGASSALGVSEVNHDEDSVLLGLALLDVEVVLQLVERLDVRPVLFVLGLIHGAARGATRLVALVAIITLHLALIAVVAVTTRGLLTAELALLSAALARPAVVGRSVTTTAVVTGLSGAALRGLSSITAATSVVVVSILSVATARRVRGAAATTTTVIIVVATIAAVVTTATTSSAVLGRGITVVIATTATAVSTTSIATTIVTLGAISGEMTLGAAGEAAAFASILVESGASRRELSAHASTVTPRRLTASVRVGTRAGPI